jgi:hypothetical protein
MMAATYDLISSQTVNTGTVTFSSISTAWTDLVLQGTYTLSATADTYCRLNNISTSTYQALGAGTQNPSGSQIFEVTNASSSSIIAIQGLPNTQTQSDNPITFELIVFDYEQSAYTKAGTLATSYITSKSVPRNNTSIFAWSLNTTAAIDRVDIIASTGNLVGTFNLYGVKAANA